MPTRSRTWIQQLLAMALVWSTVLSAVTAQPAVALSPTGGGGVEFSIIKTGQAHSPEALVFAQGSYWRTAQIDYVAVLVRRGADRFLFDTGLGAQQEQQLHDGMPWWERQLFAHEFTASAAEQLRQAHEALPNRIILSHGHWDHASGVLDFEGLPVLALQAEIDFVQSHRSSVVLDAQFRFAPSRWQTLSLDGPALPPFPASKDLYGDGSVILLPLPGHTPGSIGMLLRTTRGKRFFFVGDVAWNAKAITAMSPKFWLARDLVDDDQGQTLSSLQRVADFAKSNPDVVLIPAHDAERHGQIGYFPNWVQ